MKKRRFDRLNVEASLLGFGAMRLPCLKSGEIDYKKSEELIDAALLGGVNYFDTAWFYMDGKSEGFLGKALIKRHPRHEYYVATKLPTFVINSPEKIEQCFSDHLSRMGTDYIDFYLMHGISWESWQKLKSFGIISFIERKKAEGKIRFIGFSSHDSPTGVGKIVADYDWEFAQLQINYMDWDDLDIKSAYAAVERAGVPLIAMEPVRGGGLSNPNNPGVKRILEMLPHTTPAAIALRWVAGLDNVKVILSGMSDLAQVNENIKTLSDYRQLTGEEFAVIDAAAKETRALPIIPCTSCGYCAGCPININIPSIFQKYNSAVGYEMTYGLKVFYPREHPPGRSAADCTECGACVEACPQGIDVPTKLKDVTELYNRIAIDNG